MSGLLERSIATIERRLIILAPTRETTLFGDVRNDAERRDGLLHEMQRLRGSVYLEDGAIGREDLTFDGRHRAPEDDTSWHLLMIDARRRVTACVRYREIAADASIEALRMRDCSLRRDLSWRELVTHAVERDMARARDESLRYVEVGGWAVSRQARGSVEGLLLALGAYSLGRALGGAIGLTTATVRHCSSTILRRLGGSYFEVDGTIVPPYYDPHYDCTMELLRFDSRQPTSRYAGLVEHLKAKLTQVVVFADTAAGSESWKALRDGAEVEAVA